jgi:ParB family chromosome partitioning protein
MKRPFNLSAITADLPSLPEEGETGSAPARTGFPAVPIAKAIENQHRNAMAELKLLQANIEQSKAAGLIIEEIDPSLAEPSPYWDRDRRFLEDRTFIDLIEDMRRNGQQSPALLRPDPNKAGHYEICFGHRRFFACKSLGIKLKGVIQPLSEAQMAGSAYSENASREGVSTLEQARALAKYVQRGVFPSKQALADALNVSRSHVSNLTSFAEIPDAVLDALGDWRQCTFRDASNLLKQIREPDSKEKILKTAERLAKEDSLLGFRARLMLLMGREATTKDEIDGIRDDAGAVIAKFKRGRRSASISFLASGAGDGLANFVWSKLPALAHEFHQRETKPNVRKK